MKFSHGKVNHGDVYCDECERCRECGCEGNLEEPTKEDRPTNEVLFETGGEIE